MFCARVSNASPIHPQQIGEAVKAVHLVGGAVRCADAPAIVAGHRLSTSGYPHSDLVTPFGIAMS